MNKMYLHYLHLKRYSQNEIQQNNHE